MPKKTKVWKTQLTSEKHNSGLQKTTKVWKTQPIPEKHNHGLTNTTQFCKKTTKLCQKKLRSEKHN